jgi:hypothetical protein
VSDMKNNGGVFAFIKRVYDSVCVWFLAKAQVAELLIFLSDRAALGKSLKTVNNFRELVEPQERAFGRIGFDEFEDDLQVP